jgi:Ca2+/Na+ antiporter
VLLALSSVLGSGLFITCVVLACVLVASPQPLQLDWTFRRDTLSYLFAVLLILGVMVDGKVEFYQSSLLFAYYIGYLCMVIFFGTSTEVDDDEEDVPYKPHGLAVREFGVHPTLMWFRNVVRWELKSTVEKILSPLTVPVDVAMNLTMTTEEPGRCVQPTRRGVQCESESEETQLRSPPHKSLMPTVIGNTFAASLRPDTSPQ